jgi:hypothetical protein
LSLATFSDGCFGTDNDGGFLYASPSLSVTYLFRQGNGGIKKTCSEEQALFVWHHAVLGLPMQPKFLSAKRDEPLLIPLNTGRIERLPDLDPQTISVA